MASNMIRRITLRTIGLVVKDIRAACEKAGEGKGVALAKIVGSSSEAKTGQTDKGQFTALLGEFVGVNLLTGEVFNSGKAILPNFISEQLAAALNVSNAVDFALEIGAKADDSAVTGYVYTVRSLVDAEPTDKMKKLLGAAGITPAMLRIGGEGKADDAGDGASDDKGDEPAAAAAAKKTAKK